MKDRNYKTNKEKQFDDALKKQIEEYRFYKYKRNFVQASFIIENLKREYPNDARVIFEEAQMLSDKFNPNVDFQKGFDLYQYLINNNCKNKKAAMLEAIRVAFALKKYDLIKEYCKYLINENYKVNRVEIEYGKYYENVLRDFEKAKERYTNAKNFGSKYAGGYITSIDARLGQKLYSDLEGEILVQDGVKSKSSKESKIFYYNRKNDFHNAYLACLEYERELLKNCKEESKFGNINRIKFLLNNYFKLNKIEDMKRLIDEYKTVMSKDLYLYETAKLDLLEGNLNDAKIKFKTVIKYKNYYLNHSLVYLSEIYLIENNMEMAKNYLKEGLVNADQTFKMEIMQSLLFIYIRENKYDLIHEIYEMLGENYKKLKRKSSMQIETYLTLNSEYKYDIDEFKDYSISQFKNYNIDLFKDHIKKHIKDDDGNNISEIRSEIDLDELISEAQKYIETSSPLAPLRLFDMYIMSKYDVGETNGTRLHFLEIITLPNTKNIITMYPVASKNLYNKFYKEEKNDDIDMIVSKKEIKRKSQIEKFNERYNKGGAKTK